MRPRLALLAFCASAAVAVGACSDRERANPFDPKNPQTLGGPAGFVALAGDGRVDLRWDFVSNPGLAGYRIYRKTAVETTFRAISSLLAPTTTRYADLELLNGLDHSYRLHFVLDPEGEIDRPGEDTATPGTARPWVADPGQGKIFRLTPDGRHVAFEQAGFGGPTAVGVDSVRGLVWISDNASGRVVVLDPTTGVQVAIPGLVSPGALAVDPLSRSAWVCDEQNEVVHEFDAGGVPVGTAIEPVRVPIGVALNPRDRSVWICERGASQLRRHRADRSLVWSITLDRPSRVAFDSLAERAWVTSFETGRLYRVAPSGTVELDLSGFQGPIGVAVDPRRDRVWVADALANQIVGLNRAGMVLFRIDGLTETRDVAVDTRNGDAWAVAPRSGDVVRISASGTLLRRLGGFSEPFGIAVDPGRR